MAARFNKHTRYLVKIEFKIYKEWFFIDFRNLENFRDKLQKYCGKNIEKSFCVLLR